MRIPRRQKFILSAAWILEAVILLPPILSLLPKGSYPQWTNSHIMVVVLGPIAILQWLEVGTAKLLCVPIGIAVCAVILCRDISSRTKAIITFVGIVAYIWAVRWAGTVNFG